METVGRAPRPSERSALISVGTQFWINGMVYASFVPRLPEIRDKLAIDVGTLGLILTISSLGGLAGSALGGPLVTRLGTKKIIVFGSIGMLAALPLMGLATTPVALVGVLVVLGISDVLVDIGMNIQGSWLSARRTVPVMNRLHGLWSVGTVVGGLLAVRAAAWDISILHQTLAVSATLAALLAFSVRRLLPVDEPIETADGPDPASPTPDRPATSTPAEPAASTASAGSTRGQAVRSVQRYALLLALLGGAAVTMELITSDWASFRLADDLAAGPGLVGLGFVAFTSGMVTGRLSGDWIETRVGARRMTVFGAGLCAVGLCIAAVIPFDRIFGTEPGALLPIVVSLVGFFVAALGVSVIFPRLYDQAAKAPGPPGRGLASLTAGTRLAALGGPVAVGALANTSLSVGSALALVTLPACVVIMTSRV